MKAMLMVFAMSVGFQANAATILDGYLDEASGEIVLELGFSGGCQEHYFDLRLDRCRELFPVSCDVTLLHETTDRCEAYLFREERFSLEDYGFDDSYFQEGSLIIFGDNESSVEIRLP